MPQAPSELIQSSLKYYLHNCKQYELWMWCRCRYNALQAFGAMRCAAVRCIRCGASMLCCACDAVRCLITVLLGHDVGGIFNDVLSSMALPARAFALVLQVPINEDCARCTHLGTLWACAYLLMAVLLAPSLSSLDMMSEECLTTSYCRKISIECWLGSMIEQLLSCSSTLVT